MGTKDPKLRDFITSEASRMLRELHYGLSAKKGDSKEAEDFCTALGWWMYEFEMELKFGYQGPWYKVRRDDEEL